MDEKLRVRPNSVSFVFPDDWEDDERMNFLFQPFLDRTSNALAFDNKLKFWKELIIGICHSGYLSDNGEVAVAVCVTEDKIIDKMRRKGSSPKCLSLVLEQLVKDGALREYQEYCNELTELIKRRSSSWSTWGYQVLISSPLKKLTNKMVSVVSPKGNERVHTSYVVVDNLRKAALSFLKDFQRESSCDAAGADYKLVQPHRNLLKKCGAKIQDLDLILLWLQAQGFAVKVVTDRFGDVYKFCKSEGEKVGEPSDIELGVLEIKQTKEKLTLSIDGKQSKVDDYVKDIKSHLRNKTRRLAVQILRKKKALEESINRDMEHVNKLDCVLEEIYESATNQLVLRAYEKGAKALKSLTDTTPPEQVDATMDSLADGLCASDQFTAALMSPLTVESSDADQLEKELEELLADDESSESISLARLNDLTIIDAASPLADGNKGARRVLAS